jgi:hypothetical protein
MVENEVEIAYTPEFWKNYELFLETDKYLLQPKFQWKDLVIPKELGDDLKMHIILPQKFPQLFTGRHIPRTVALYGVKYPFATPLTPLAFRKWKIDFSPRRSR